MKKTISISIAYLTTGIGVYYTFFGNSKFYGLTILTISLLGIILLDIYNKLNKDTR